MTEETPSPPEVGLLGLGRVGSTLALAMTQAGVGCIVWDRSHRARAKARSILGQGRVAATLDHLYEAPLVILCVPDAVLAEMKPRRSSGGRAAVAHTSGLFPGRALGSFREVGYAVGSWHPLRSFAKRWPTAAESSLAGTVFALEGGPALVRRLRSLTTRLGGRPASLCGSRKALYHAAAALTANHSLLLADTALSWMKRAGLPEHLARAGLAALLASAAHNLEVLGPRRGLTGPLVRGDVDAVRHHLEALAGSDPKGEELYRFTALAGLCRPGGALAAMDPATRRRLAEVLGGPRSRSGSRRGLPGLGGVQG